eukprot:1348253-Lingulodinium_polyedra.AAC.1
MFAPARARGGKHYLGRAGAYVALLHRVSMFRRTVSRSVAQFWRSWKLQLRRGAAFCGGASGGGPRRPS